MDGKLTGCLSLGLRLTGRLSVMPRGSPPPEPVLVEKRITANGRYRAADDGADGYSVVTTDVAAERLEPYAFDLTGGYVMSGSWVPGGDTVNYSDMYAITAGQVYIIALGATVGARFRAMFSVEDVSTATERVVGRQIINTSNPEPYAYVVYKSTEDGFIIITKDNSGTAGLRTFVYCLADLIGGA